MTEAPRREPEGIASQRVKRGGRRRDSSALVVLGIAAFLIVAVAKPWDWGNAAGPLPPAAATGRTGSPRPASASAAATTPAPPVPTDNPSTVAGAGFDAARVDWAAATAGLQPRDGPGLRALLVDPTSDQPAPDGGTTMSETWLPSSPADDTGATGPGPAGSDQVVDVETSGKVVAALGVTSGGDPVLDLRAWVVRDGEFRPVDVEGFPVAGDPSDRIITPGGSAGGHGWAPGDYRIDALLGRSVWHLGVRVSGPAAPLPADVPALPAPPDAEMSQLDAVPGAFAISGTRALSYQFDGIVPALGASDEGAEWLGLGAQALPWAPGLSSPQPLVVGAPTVIGASAGPDASFVSATLVRVSPTAATLGQAALLAGSSSGRRSAVAVFRPAPPAASWPLGVYRIDAVVQPAGRATTLHWLLALLPPGEGTASPLLQGLRSWYHQPAGTWAVVAPGREAPVAPAVRPPDASSVGPSCTGGVSVGASPEYIGLSYPGTDRPTVEASWLTGSFGLQRIAMRGTQAVDGLTLGEQSGSAAWSAGTYVFALQMRGGAEYVTVCVG